MKFIKATMFFVAALVAAIIQNWFAFGGWFCAALVSLDSAVKEHRNVRRHSA